MTTRYRQKRLYVKNDTTDAKTKSLRGLCHKRFDFGWSTKLGWDSRDEAYKWLQSAMNLSADKAHISLFDESQCLKLLDILKEIGL